MKKGLIICSITFITVLSAFAVVKTNESKFIENNAREHQNIPKDYETVSMCNEDLGTIGFLFYDLDKTDFVYSIYCRSYRPLKTFRYGGHPIWEPESPISIQKEKDFTIFIYYGCNSVAHIDFLDFSGETIYKSVTCKEPAIVIFPNEQFYKIVRIRITEGDSVKLWIQP